MILLLSVLLSLIPDIQKGKHVSNCGATIVVSTFFYLTWVFSSLFASVNFDNSFSAHPALPSRFLKTKYSVIATSIRKDSKDEPLAT